MYKAHDITLNRPVALKLLPEGQPSDRDVQASLILEACAASALNHPNIVVIYDVIRVDQQDGIVMEFVDGETLSQPIRTKQLSLDDVLTYGEQIVDALSAAHTAGIVHRDLKPGNIMINRQGRTKILDFGLAKLLEPELDWGGEATPTVALTKEGTIKGTVQYMSPEQAKGMDVDARSDIYSVGSVLFEMLTGERPFEGESPLAMLHAVASGKPKSLQALRPDLPPSLQLLVTRAMHNDIERRYQSCQELLADVRTVRREVQSGTVSSGQGEPAETDLTAVAVLPLRNLTGSPDQEYFVDGLTEALIVDLAKIRGLKVMSRASIMRYKGTDKSPQEIARELNVGALLEGSFLKAGERVRITAQLVDAATDHALWAESFDRGQEDILSIQSEVARAIAEQIQVQLSPGERAELARPRRVDPEAHEAYLKGRYHWNQRTLDGLLHGIEFFRAAIDRDPAYAVAYVGLSDSYNLLGYYNVRPPKETYPLAKASAAKALEIDEGIAEAHASLGYTRLFFDWDWEGAATSFERAITLNPSYASGHQWYGWYFFAAGRLDRAMTAMQRALELDPLSLIINDHMALALSLAGKHEQAIDRLQETLELDADYPLAHQRLGVVYIRQGEPERAIPSLRRAVKLSDGNVGLGRLGLAYGLADRRDEAVAVLERLADRTQQRFTSPLETALVHLGLADYDSTLKWIERAIDQRISDLVRFDLYPWPPALREDPRWQQLRERLGLPGE